MAKIEMPKIEMPKFESEMPKTKMPKIKTKMPKFGNRAGRLPQPSKAPPVAMFTCDSQVQVSVMTPEGKYFVRKFWPSKIDETFEYEAWQEVRFRFCLDLLGQSKEVEVHRQTEFDNFKLSVDYYREFVLLDKPAKAG